MLWTRPAKMFFSDIDVNREDNLTGQTHRFELVEELSEDYIKKQKELDNKDKKEIKKEKKLRNKLFKKKG